MSQWFAFDTNCEYLGYDQVAKDYFKEFTININAITVPELHHDVDSYEKIISSDSIQADRLRSMVSKNLLKKRFDYTFTGLNTEVIDLDISLSTTYYQIQALNSGSNKSIAQAVGGASTPTSKAAIDKGTLKDINDKIKKQENIALEINQELKIGKFKQ